MSALVALLAEGVDRNPSMRPARFELAPSPSSRRAWIEMPRMYAEQEAEQVALLAEGVDRNRKHEYKRNHFCSSPSSRRAWIEMYRPKEGAQEDIVALLAEGVDRNVDAITDTYGGKSRPPRGGRG